MNTISLKRLSFLEFTQQESEKTILGFCFGTSLHRVSPDKPVVFNDVNNFGINIYHINTEKTIHPTLRDAFNACVEENLKLMDEYINETIPKSDALFKYSFLGQLFKKNRASRKIVDKVSKNVNDYKKFLDDKAGLDAYFKEHYEKHEDVIHQKISVTDSKLKLAILFSCFMKILSFIILKIILMIYLDSLNLKFLN